MGGLRNLRPTVKYSCRFGRRLKSSLRNLARKPLRALNRILPNELSKLEPMPRKHPVIFTNAYGIRFIRYPWDLRPLTPFLTGEYVKAEFAAMRGLLQPGDIVLDVGSSIGLYSVFASRIVGPSGKVYAFEPVPETFWMLHETLVLNRCTNVTPLQKAVYSDQGTVKIHLFKSQYAEWNTLGMPTMTTPQGRKVMPTNALTVACESIDNFCSEQGIDRISFLKVDVEGFEKKVFEGATHFLADRRIDFISFEISQDPLKGAHFTAKETFEILASFGYHSFAFSEVFKSFTGPITDSNEYWANYFASTRDLSQYRFADVQS